MVNGLAATDKFLPTAGSDLALSVSNMCLGTRNPIPRPEIVSSPFGEYDVRPFDSHVSYLENSNQYAKFYELKFTHMIGSYLFELAV